MLMKTCLTTVALFAAGSLHSLLSAPVSAAQVSMARSEAALPAPINELLKAKFSQWRPKQVSDVDAHDRQLWLKAHEKECPGIAVGYFESADRLSYAALLVPKSEPRGGYKIVVISKGPTGDAYTWRLLDHADGQTYSGLVISKAEPGLYSDFELTESIQTKLDGVYVEWIEKGAQLYYWSGDRYRKLQLSD
jgi:hypothetical protein